MQRAGRQDTGAMEQPRPSGSMAGGLTGYPWASQMLLEVYI